MKNIIQKRMHQISEEVAALHEERLKLIDRQKDIDIRLHQLLGALYELQGLSDQDPDHEDSSLAPEDLTIRQE